MIEKHRNIIKTFFMILILCFDSQPNFNFSFTFSNFNIINSIYIILIFDCLFSFFPGMSIMEEREDVFEELTDKFVPTFLRSCCFWLPAQSLNFTYIAPRFRIVYMGLCGVAWINILCWMKRQNYHTITGAVITAQPLPEEEPKESETESEPQPKSDSIF